MWIALLLTGCSDSCGSPQQLNGRAWEAFLTSLEYGPADLDGFPASTSPANGEHVYQFDWASDAVEGPVTVTVDGQAFEGDGTWNALECGNFTARWSGVYNGDDGSTHAFSAGGSFVAWPGNLDGFIDWDETWRIGSDVGDFSSTAVLRATGNF